MASRLLELLTFFCLALIAINIASILLPPLKSDYPHDGNALHYTQRELSPFEALRKFRQLKSIDDPDGKSKVHKLFELVSRSFVHGKSYKLRWYDNWYLWLQSLIEPSDFKREVLLDTQKADLLWRRGRGYCHQAAWIFTKYARELGFQAGLVKLNNHYVAEVKTNSDIWYTADPDLGLWWKGRFESAEFQEELQNIHQKLLDAGFSSTRADTLSDLYKISMENVKHRSFYYTSKIYLNELLAFQFMWILPFVGFLSSLSGIFLLRRKKRKAQG